VTRASPAPRAPATPAREHRPSPPGHDLFPPTYHGPLTVGPLFRCELRNANILQRVPGAAHGRATKVRYPGPALPPPAPLRSRVTHQEEAVAGMGGRGPCAQPPGSQQRLISTQHFTRMARRRLLDWLVWHSRPRLCDPMGRATSRTAEGACATHLIRLKCFRSTTTDVLHNRSVA